MWGMWECGNVGRDMTTGPVPPRPSGVAPGTAPETDSPPSRTEALEATWREYYRRASEAPRHPAARDFLHLDLTAALARLIPSDASVLEVGCGEGDLLAALPNARRQGIDYLPETVARARARHPGIGFELGDAISPPPNLVHRADAVICDRLCHSVLDVKALLTGLKRQLAPDGRIYLTTFNYLWEVPVRLAEMAGLKRPAPTSNWLSDSDFRNLYDITGRSICRSSRPRSTATRSARRR
jgi:SAM-dependent methyltransferase